MRDVDGAGHALDVAREELYGLSGMNPVTIATRRGETIFFRVEAMMDAR